MAFPGCVIFLPPTAAAARFLLAVYDSWWAGKPPRPVAAAAARRRDGGCGGAAELGHLRTAQPSHGHSHTENGFSSEDMALVRTVAVINIIRNRPQCWRKTSCNDNNKARRASVTDGGPSALSGGQVMNGHAQRSASRVTWPVHEFGSPITEGMVLCRRGETQSVKSFLI